MMQACCAHFAEIDAGREWFGNTRSGDARSTRQMSFSSASFDATAPIARTHFDELKNQWGWGAYDASTPAKARPV